MGYEPCTNGPQTLRARAATRAVHEEMDLLAGLVVASELESTTGVAES